MRQSSTTSFPSTPTRHLQILNCMPQPPLRQSMSTDWFVQGAVAIIAGMIHAHTSTANAV